MIKHYLRILVYLVGFSVICIIVVFLFLELVDFDREVEVPLLTGKGMREANDLLKNRKLSLKIEGEGHDPEIPVGNIIRQDIKPGERVKRGTDIKVILSRGSEIFSMPSFEGQKLDEVKLTLANLELEIGKITRVHSDRVEKDMIIAQRPLPGYVGSNQVNFLVSAGLYERSYKCPSFINMSLADAKDLAEVLGLRLTISDEGSKIIFQKPEAGTIMHWGDSVEVKLGRGWGLWF